MMRRAAVSLSIALALAACQPVVRPNLANEPVAVAVPEPIEPTLAPAIIPELPVAEIAVESPDPVHGTGGMVFERIRKGLGTRACEAGSNSEKWRRRYAGNPRSFANHLQEILPLLDFVSTEVDRAGLPSEFVFIPLVESWYRPEAIGVNGPAGMWQMIGSTARNHGIHIRPGYDGRLSPVESTRAALSYLKTLDDSFGGWQAVVMAYNAGEGRMSAAFNRNRSQEVSAASRKPHGLSNITYDYVAKLQALSCLIAEPARHGLQLPVAAQFIPLAPVLMDSDIHTLAQFAARHGQNAGELRRLNPGFKGGRVMTGVPRLVLTPFGMQQSAPDSGAALADAAAETSPAPDAANGTHRVNAGESLWSIARLYSLSIEQLRRINKLGRSSVLQPGQTLKLAP